MNARRTWRFSDGMWLAGLSATAVAASWPIWNEIYSIAIRNEEQSHILLTPAIVCWLVWVRRSRLRQCRPAPSLLGVLTIGLGWVLAWWGFSSQVEVARHFGAVLIVFGALLSVVGPRFVQRFFPAAIALVFLLPVPGRVRRPIALELQERSAIVTEYILDLFSVPIVRSGNALTVNGVEVAVAEACNGMRMVAALGLVTFAFVFSFPMRNSIRIAILALAPLIALLVNIIRLIPTVLMYGYAEHSAAELFHDISGWIMLFIGLGILFSLLNLLRWLQVPLAPKYALSPN